MAAAAVMTEPTVTLPSPYPIEFLFDLDTVLSGADDLDCSCQITPSDSPVADFPTVVADVCAVCLDDFRPDEAGKQIPCGHVYHESCISSWLTVADCCPLCRCLVAGQPPDSTLIRR
ncbi:RING-H2 finger protein ATL5-like [Cucumis melo var. makuwa]|uniref:RING-H2 finger protein ATL5-like n=2 Tax=Cucumis melo TaxID=3656 RepID=A0A1S4DZX3_CUCME|nr:RING-H2 finger protein ATL5-like [Cucumis melo]KAA0061530.1 RING-H2 finger protein ATL5-like [Cucumis melo var. makuwa]TYK10743.1 RING-H2 finger protein ATL5-like [Cucumis melo var. makuwa]